MQTAAGGPLFPWRQNTEWINDWKFRTTPASRSRVLSGKGVETDKQYTERRKKETTKRTWRSDAADIVHGIGEGVLALHPYTAIPYFGAKVGQDFLNNNIGWHTALNVSIPLFHMAPNPSLNTVINSTLEDAAKAGSKTAKNWRIVREMKDIKTPQSTPPTPKNLFRATVFKGGPVKDPDLSFFTTDPKYASQYGKPRAYIMESQNFTKAKEPLMGSSDPVTTDMFIYNNTKNNPTADLLLGHDKVTGEFPYKSKGIEMISLNRNNVTRIKPKHGRTSFAFRKNLYEDYSSPTGKTSDIFKRFYFQELISGKPRLSGTSNELQFDQSVKKGLPWQSRYNLQMRTVQRNIDEFKKEGYTDSEIQAYKDKVEKLMDDVNIGYYTGKDYENAGMQDTGGFFNADNNFISVNKDNGFPSFFVEKHEGRHLIDYNSSLLTSQLQKLFKAYDGKFLNLPKVSEKLKDYEFMHRERVTTNRDARDRLLGEEVYMSPSLENKIIEGMPDDAVFEAVENANRYGKEYIEYLRKNNGLTPQKAHDFRQAMKYVGASTPFIFGYEKIMPKSEGWGIYSNKYNGGFSTTYLKYPNYMDDPINIKKKKQGGKMNMLKFLKNGSGIHIKEKNKGKFTSYCGGKVTDECIQKAKASGNPTLVKRATFAQNAKRWKHKEGGNILKLSKEKSDYLEWSKMTPEQKREYRTNRVKSYLQSGPNITNFWEAFQTYIGNRDPKNPNLNVGVINITGTPVSSLSTLSTASRAMGGPKNIFSLNKLWRMVNKRVGRNIDSEEFSDLISNSSINNIRNAVIESDNNFPIIRITEQEANDFINSLKPGLKQGGSLKSVNARKWKHKEGGSIEKLEKGSWINKGLNFLNESGLGKTLVEGGLSLLQSNSQNKSIAGATDVAKAELDKEKQEASDYALQMATKKAQEMQLIDSNNPNAFGGSIVQNYIRQQLYNEYLNSINQDIANRKAQLDMQSQQMQNENTSGAISGIIQSGLGVVGNFLGGKKGTSSTNITRTSSSTKSIVQPKLTSNKWTPSTSLSNPVLGNNAQGSMPNYTSLLNV